MTEAILALAVVVASAVLSPILLRRRGPPPMHLDLPAFGLGFLGMLISDHLQDSPASVWSPFIDLGSFAVGTSLLVTAPAGTWPRWVGAMILGIHAAQVLVTNQGALLGNP